MICLAVHLNERLLCMAGHTDAEVISAIVGGGRGSQWDDPVAFHVACVFASPTGEHVHHYLIERTVLVTGDRLEFSLVQSDSPTQFPETLPIGPSDEISVREGDEALRTMSALTSIRPATPREVKLQLRLSDHEPVVLGVPLGQEHALCSISWIKRRPDRCEVYARTFSGAEADERATDWLQSTLKVGQVFEVLMSA